MAFVKTGDMLPIDTFFDGDGALKCDKCGRNKTSVKLAAEMNEIVCECEIALVEDDDECN
jgi:hypothetical protein